MKLKKGMIPVSMDWLLSKAEDHGTEIALTSELNDAGIGTKLNHITASSESLGKSKMIAEIMEHGKNNLKALIEEETK